MSGVKTRSQGTDKSEGSANGQALANGAAKMNGVAAKVDEKIGETENIFLFIPNIIGQSR